MAWSRGRKVAVAHALNWLSIFFVFIRLIFERGGLGQRVFTSLKNRRAQVRLPNTKRKIMGKPVVHFEIGCRNSQKTQEFFAKLFDWQINVQGPAALINTGDTAGIQGHITALGHEPHNYVTVYVQVDDLQAYLDRANQLGGKTLVPPVEIPGQGSFAWLADLDGNIIGLWKPMSK
jgi:predicted enzyme related to lactoylglutathione lyase